MSGQLLELIIFAGIAFLVINKLVSTLGTTSEEDSNDGKKRKSFFGETTGRIKDVTSTMRPTDILRPTKIKIPAHLIAAEQVAEVQKAGTDLAAKLPNFTAEKFINSAKTVFKMVIEASQNDHNENLQQLLDKRYVVNFQEQSKQRYEQIDLTKKTQAYFTEIYHFGNNVFIKILFEHPDLTEEWTFTKSLLETGPRWYLANVDQAEVDNI